jgi:UDP-N-acetylmuramyl pentapeptide phosphotransferase/UDP-N-acetylglucosamine-1-phosphate transferase
LPAFAFGLAEDLTKRISVRARLLATLSCGVLGYFITGYSITDVNVPGIDWLLGFSVLSVTFTAFAVGGVANALNIIDGMNGLASGVVIIVLIGFAALSYSLGDTELMLTCCILAFSVAGFFMINWPLGKIFLGDGGACFLGFALGWIGVLVLARHAEVSAWAPLLACGLPVLEVVFSMLRRRRRGQKLGDPDCLHLHSLIHRRLVRRFLSRASPLARNSIAGALMSCAGALPVWVAVHWATDTPMLVLAVALCTLVYLVTYARLTQFRWCFGALTSRRPVDIKI